MKLEIFTEWLTNFDKDMKKQRKKNSTSIRKCSSAHMRFYAEQYLTFIVSAKNNFPCADYVKVLLKRQRATLDSFC